MLFESERFEIYKSKGMTKEEASHYSKSDVSLLQQSKLRPISLNQKRGSLVTLSDYITMVARAYNVNLMDPTIWERFLEYSKHYELKISKEGSVKGFGVESAQNLALFDIYNEIHQDKPQHHKYDLLQHHDDYLKASESAKAQYHGLDFSIKSQQDIYTKNKLLTTLQSGRSRTKGGIEEASHVDDGCSN